MEVCENNTHKEFYVCEYKWRTNNFFNERSYTRIRNSIKESYEVNSTSFRNDQGNYLWSLRLFCEKHEDDFMPTALHYYIEIQCNSLTSIFHEKKIEILLNIHKGGYNTDYETIRDCVNSKENCKQYFLFDDLHLSDVTDENSVTITFRSVEPILSVINIPEMHKLSCDYEELLKSGSNSDFKIIIGEKEFLVHKIILATRSEYFALMFKYSDTNKKTTLEITDVDGVVMTTLLRYIYCAKINIAEELLYSLLTAADMYQINDLTKKCEQLIICNLKTNNVGECMAYAERYCNDSLKVASANFLMKCASQFSEDDINALKTNMVSISSPFMTSLVCSLLFKNETITV